MSMWIGGASLLLTAYQASEAEDQEDASYAQNKKAQKFEEKKYENWQKIYGPIESNLGKFYNSMTPESYASKGIQEFNKQNKIALENIRTNLAQRGLYNSGTAAAVEIASELGGAEKKATIRANADEAVAAEQERFLQIGLGQNPGASYSQSLSQQAQQANINSRYASQQARAAIGDSISTVGKALQDYNRNQTNQNAPQPVGTINNGDEYGNVG